MEPVIQDLSPIAKAIKFSRCTLGKIPPRIGGIKVYPGKVMLKIVGIGTNSVSLFNFIALLMCLYHFFDLESSIKK